MNRNMQPHVTSDTVAMTIIEDAHGGTHCHVDVGEGDAEAAKLQLLTSAIPTMMGRASVMDLELNYEGGGEGNIER